MVQLLASIIYLAAEEEPEGIDLVLPEFEELIAGVIAFAIVFLVFWRWGVPAIKRALEARQEAITGQLEEAEKAKVEAEGLLGDYRKQLAEARTEANQIVEEARKTAESVRSDVVAKAEGEAAEITRKAREEAAAEKERAADQIKQEVAALSLELAQRVVGETVDRDSQKALVDRYIDELGELSD
jgi:F-type H+-transporting ATPase subunit b